MRMCGVEAMNSRCYKITTAGSGIYSSCFHQVEVSYWNREDGALQ